MERKWTAPPDWLLNALDPRRVGGFLLLPRVRAVAAWAAVSLAAAYAFQYAWTAYNNPGHPEGNLGHIYIDFAGQWLMGRMMARGEGRFLYDKAHLRQALRDAYRPDDAATIDGWLIESEDRPGVGGPLYPPIHALLYYPLGLLPPQTAYRLIQVGNFVLTFLIGFLAWMLTRGRVWPSVAAGVVLAFPGWPGAACLGQNALLSLALLTLGWLLVSRNRPWLGGVVWGLLAFKPVWAASFFLVPLLMWRWRVCAAMLLTGLALALLTLPFVGWQTWLDWLTVGRAASVHYTTDETWIFLSRDLQSIPRRWLLDFDADGRATNPDLPLPNLLGQGLWLTVAALTVLVALWRWRRPAGVEGPPAAFLMTGAWLSCFHFMYYDTLLAALPVCLLFTEPWRYFSLPAWAGDRAGVLGVAEVGAFGSPGLGRTEVSNTSPQGFRLGSVGSVQTGASEDSSPGHTQGIAPAPVSVNLRRYSPLGLWLWNLFPPLLLVLLLLLPHLADSIDALLHNGRAAYHSPPYDTFCLLALWLWCGWRWLRPIYQPEAPARDSMQPLAGAF